MTRKGSSAGAGPLSWQQVKELAEALKPMLREGLENDLKAVGSDVKGAIATHNNIVDQHLAKQDERLNDQDAKLDKIEDNTRKGLRAWTIIVFLGSCIGGVFMDWCRSLFHK